MRITAGMLRRKRACRIQFLKFIKRFPDGVEVTEDTCLYVANDFDWDWAAENLLSEEGLNHYREGKERARQMYDDVIISLCQAYTKKVTPAYRTYKEEMASARQAYAIHKTWEVYDDAMAKAWRVYNKVVVSAYCERVEAEDEAYCVYNQGRAIVFAKACEKMDRTARPMWFRLVEGVRCAANNILREYSHN